jgi:phosphoesterase RecJ-like protein
MDPYKTSRLNHAIQKTLGELLQSAVKDPRVGLVSVNAVQLNRDHSVAKVFYSVLGEDEDRQRSLAGLKKARGFLQGRLAHTLKLRQTPELRFVYDRSLDRSLQLETVLLDLDDQGEFVSEEERQRRLALADLVPPAELLDALCRGERFWVVPHWNPDPDAVGGALALGAALRAMGRQARVLCYPDPPVGLLDLPGYAEALPLEEVEATLAAEPPDTLVFVDSHRRDRVGPLTAPLQAIANAWAIDHHLLSGRRAPLPGWVEPRACSASTLVHQVVAALATGADGRCEPFDFTLDMATCLYAGLLNDTGGFRFSNTTPLSFELARKLARQGVDTATVARLTLHRYRREGVELMQRALATFRYEAEGRILAFYVDREMLAATGATLADTEGFVNVATAVDGVFFMAFCKEMEPDTWRVSLRSPGGGDVQDVAARYGGGGHRQAAGCTLSGSAESVIETLVADLRARL